jgi:hypothetical protein
VEQGLYPPSPGFAGKVCRAFTRLLGQGVYTWDVWPGYFNPLELKGKLLTVMQQEPEFCSDSLSARRSVAAPGEAGRVATRDGKPEYGSRLGREKTIF